MTAATVTHPNAPAQPVAPALRETRQRDDATGGPVLTIGVDVGGTKTSCVVTDANDEMIYRDVVPTEANRLAGQIVELVGRAVAGVQGAGMPGSGRVGAIGVAVPGLVEPRSGSLDLAVNLGGRDIDLGSKVSEATGLPCFVEHDARAAAIWVYERVDAGARDGADLCYLSLGTGIAAGIVLDGRILRGETGLAGEVGHAFAEVDGIECACGLRGCLETVAAGPAIARMAREAVARAMSEGRSTTLTPDVAAADVFAASVAGDAVATEIATRVGTYLARAIRALVLTLGVRRVVIGGGVAASGAALLTPILAALAAERRVSRLIETVFADTTLDVLEPGLEPGARGAASIARRALLGAQNKVTRPSPAHREGVGDR